MQAIEEGEGGPIKDSRLPEFRRAEEALAPALAQAEARGGEMIPLLPARLVASSDGVPSRIRPAADSLLLPPVAPTGAVAAGHSEVVVLVPGRGALVELPVPKGE